MRFRLRPTVAALAAGTAAAPVSAAFASAATGPSEAEMLVKIADTTAISDLAYREDGYLSDVIGRASAAHRRMAPPLHTSWTACAPSGSRADSNR